jgi:hypothetical protein
MTHRLLGHKGNLLPVLLNIKLVDRLTIEKNLASEGVVEALDQLNAGRTSDEDPDHRRERAYTVLLPQPLAPTKAT